MIQKWKSTHPFLVMDIGLEIGAKSKNSSEIPLKKCNKTEGGQLSSLMRLLSMPCSENQWKYKRLREMDIYCALRATETRT